MREQNHVNTDSVEGPVTLHKLNSTKKDVP